MIVTDKGFLVFVVGFVAAVLLVVMFVTGRTNDVILWLAFAALVFVAIVLNSRRRASDPVDELGPGMDDLDSPARPLGKAQSTEFVTNTSYVFDLNGERHEYASLDEVPPHLRAMMEKAQASGGERGITINLNGEERTYDSIDDVPEEYREMLRRMGQP